MATQPTPSYEQLTPRAPLPVLRRRTVAPPPFTTTPVRATSRGEQRQAEDRQRLLVEMLPLVKRMAFKIREHLPAQVELDDLLADGVLGLVDAVARFDKGKQVKLESYARHRVRGGILDGLRGADPASRDLRRKSKKIQKLYREIEVKTGRPVRDEEMAAALGITLPQWHATLNEVQSVGFDFGARTVTAGPTAKRPCTEPSLLADNGADPFELCYRREQKQIMGRALARLRERERQIIDLYYQQELTMKQIAERLHVDESRVSQLHSAALMRLKASVAALLAPRHPAAANSLARAAGA